MESILKSPAFVVHLKRATERYELFMKNVANAGFTDIRIFDAIDGSNLDSVTNAQTVLGDKCVFDIEPLPGEIGCLLSHLMLWKKIVNENIEIATVFEDDVHFHPEWNTLSEKYFKNTPGDFDIIFIGNGLDSCRLETNTAPEINTESAWCTHAYIITKKGASRMMDAILNWDYANFYHGIGGYIVSGLYAIDIMIKDTQNNILLNKIPKSFTWYCWNGTYYPCEHNKLPVKGNDSRNTGLVFQNTDIFKTYVKEYALIEIEPVLQSTQKLEDKKIPVVKQRKLIWNKVTTR